MIASAPSTHIWTSTTNSSFIMLSLRPSMRPIVQAFTVAFSSSMQRLAALWITFKQFRRRLPALEPLMQVK
jgi:hypothetical protein